MKTAVIAAGADLDRSVIYPDLSTSHLLYQILFTPFIPFSCPLFLSPFFIVFISVLRSLISINRFNVLYVPHLQHIDLNRFLKYSHDYSLAKQPDIAVSVDLLVVLLADEDSAVRKAALEVYLRRVYRAHTIMTLSIADEDGIISAEWSFTTK